MHHVFMYPKSVLTDPSHIMTGCGRVGQNRLLDQVELHTTGCVQFDTVFRTLRKYMNRLRFRFDPKREKNRTEPDLQTLHLALPDSSSTYKMLLGLISRCRTPTESWRVCRTEIPTSASDIDR